MNNMQIFEPASCCAKESCNANSADDIVRIARIIEILANNNIQITRFNLSSSPMEFVKNDIVHQLLYKEGVSKLPLTVLDNEIVISSRYPTNDEFIKLLNLTSEIVESINQSI